jgi:hypothetical protein
VNRRKLGAALVLSGLVFGIGCGTALAATTPKPAAHATTPAVHRSAFSPGPIPPVFTGDTQAFAVRIEADEPLPVGPGDIPSVSGQLNAQEDFSTATAAVDLLGAVVGPKIADPTGDGHQYTQLPEASCVYPSEPNAGAQSYPFNGNDQQTAQSEAACSAGPSATGLAYAGQIGGGAGITNPNELATLQASSLPLGIQGVAAGHESLGPDPADGSVLVTADAEVHDFSIPGLLHVAGVEAAGSTEVSGRPGGATSTAQVTVSGLSIGGATISVSPKGVQLGAAPPVPVSGAAPLVQQFNQIAGTEGCSLTILSNPSDYPQGTLFARPPLPDRINANGTDAGSTDGGVVVRCVVPEALNPTNFKPLIMQIVFGFVGTEANASLSVPQLGIGSVGPVTPPPIAAPPASLPASLPVASAPVSVPAAAPALVTPSAAPAPVLPPATPTAASLPAVTRPVGALLPLRTTLEASGLGLGILLSLAGVGLVAPWRVTLAPAGHPEA